eukprot:snap_masked-scaffold_14-processed-gene-9.6-mRNA-1 protein AED:1.00 eAED:1.00 QI:0/0/0/0/1/1/2/0/72
MRIKSKLRSGFKVCLYLAKTVKNKLLGNVLVSSFFYFTLTLQYIYLFSRKYLKNKRLKSAQQYKLKGECLPS